MVSTAFISTTCNTCLQPLIYKRVKQQSQDILKRWLIKPWDDESAYSCRGWDCGPPGIEGEINYEMGSLMWLSNNRGSMKFILSPQNLLGIQAIIIILSSILGWHCLGYKGDRQLLSKGSPYILLVWVSHKCTQVNAFPPWGSPCGCEVHFGF